MLRKILDAYDGELPDDGHVAFENTGKEREETLEYIDECSRRWDVPIHWLEYRWEPGRHYFVEVDFATASRNGEPFEAVIQARGGILPNPTMRFCTAEMKIRTSNRFVHQSLGWDVYNNVIGLRADEPKRVAKMLAKKVVEYLPTLWEDWMLKVITHGANHPPGERPMLPLATAGATLQDVMGYWQDQRGGMELEDWLDMPKEQRPGWDLALMPDEGNCDLCFLKGGAKLLGLIKDRPDSADWWAAQEDRAAQGLTRNKSVEQFRKDRPGYRELAMIATDKQTGPGWLWADEPNGSCGEVDECRCTD